MVVFQNVLFSKITSDNVHILDEIYQYESDEKYLRKIKGRLEKPSIWQGFIASYDGKPAGCFWILAPNAEDILHDSFMVTAEGALFCGAYVNPPYRGMRIYGAMQYFAYDLIKETMSCRKLIIIVEKSNQPSLNSIFRFKYHSMGGKNYLLKIMGRNILSIYASNSGKLQIWFVGRVFS